ncbi:protein sneaky [Vanessa cardui]|uniref:protein sneaky n=1 Tax=Vanessa cardui TaxID=171605 RepID=UPI001F12BA66|nr:protein sneaky [Vanessa cardui]
MKKSLFEKLGIYLLYIIRIYCPLLHLIIFSEYHEKRILKVLLGFIVGFCVGQLYFNLFLKDIPFLNDVGFILGIIVSVILGVSIAVSVQVRCISFLLLPMYCGKAGRGILKAIVLTYVVAGPITNMGLNAKEVVRVFACTTELSYNLSKHIYAQSYLPLNKALLDFTNEIVQIKENIRSIRDVISPIDYEIKGFVGLQQMKNENYFTDTLFDIVHDTDEVTKIFQLNQSTEEMNPYMMLYIEKMELRCENQLSHTVTMCMDIFASAYETCSRNVPSHAVILCWPLMLPHICDVKRSIRSDICNFKNQIDSGLGEGYTYLKLAKRELTTNLDTIKLQHKIHYERKLYDIQDAKETGERVLHAFAEKYTILKFVNISVYIFLALLFLRIPIASANYHDLYLTCIDYDNVYITDYFKRIDEKRCIKNKVNILPLKKMERNRYIDVHSTSYIPSERNKLLTQILKVMLEAVTATTFVMLDRLFYEALEVVRQHALEESATLNVQDIAIQVEGKGPLSSMLRKLLREFNINKCNKMVSNDACVPRPRAMPSIYYFKIYGGYLWILLLLYINPFTLRLRRLICSYFYYKREKERVLHLYNDILKKRLRMQKTLRKKAVQAVRAHYLSGENLLSMRMRYPQLLGWLGKLSVARMKCLICEETEPKYASHKQTSIEVWHSCISTRCPFVYCNECWMEVGSQCLACDPALAELSDVDSLSDNNPPRY